MTAPRFWKSAGLHLVERGAEGALRVTPDLVRAYFTRPEVHPVEESCEAEHRLFESLMADPFRSVTSDEIASLEDPDARQAYEIVLRYRDHLLGFRSLEAAYLGLFHPDAPLVPPVFIDQLVHLILADMLASERDALKPRAAELFFREQSVATDNDRIMLADAEIVLRRQGNNPEGAAIDVLSEETKDAYWARSDRFDTALDFRFAEPAQDAFARILESWIERLLGVATRIQPLQSIRDERWIWHVGLDTESTRILNSLYRGEATPADPRERILALFRLEFLDATAAIEALEGRPVYLGLAMNGDARMRMKPQNILTNLPLRKAT